MKYFEDILNTSVHISEGYYSVGLELEFKTKTQYMSNKYRTEIKKGIGTFKTRNGLQNPHTNKNAWNIILGLDGCSTTQEFRSPVFISKDKNDAVSQLEIYSVEIRDFLRKNFKALFAPYLFNCSLGLHLSIGGEYLTNINNLNETVEICKRIQPLLITRLESEDDKNSYLSRENNYPGNISHNLKFSKNWYGFLQTDWCNSIKVNENRVEFRFFPSCDIETVFPYLETILLGKSIPNSIIKFIKE